MTLSPALPVSVSAPSVPTIVAVSPKQVAVVTAGDGAESGPAPYALTASTRKVYGTPSVRPVRLTAVTFPTTSGFSALPRAYGTST